VILLDTHALIWLASEPATCYPKKPQMLFRVASQEGGIGISLQITLWELPGWATHGRLRFTGTVDAFVERISLPGPPFNDHGQSCRPGTPMAGNFYLTIHATS